MSQARARARGALPRAASPRSSPGRASGGARARGSAGGTGGGRVLGASAGPAMLPPGTVDAKVEIDSILDLQRTHGNRAVVQLIAATEAPSANVGARADDLVRAVTFEFPFFRVDVERAVAALTGLAPSEARAVATAFERRLKIPLSLVVGKAQNLGRDDRNRLNTLLQGDTGERIDTSGARKVGEAAGAFVGSLASSLGVDLDVDEASRFGGEALAVTSAAAQEPERAASEAGAAVRRRVAEAIEVHSLLTRTGKERLFVLLGRSHADRMAIADAYAKEYRTSLYNDLNDKLSGRERERALALWRNQTNEAERLALEAETEQRRKLDEQATKFAPVATFVPAARDVVRRRDEARSKQETRVESLAITGQLEDVLARGGPTLEGAIERDKVLTFLRQGNVPETMAARLVRADRESKLTAAMLEEALRGLDDRARADAKFALMDSPLGPIADVLSPLFVDAYYRRLESRFDWEAGTGRTFRKAIAGTGDKARRERNAALLRERGQLEPWEELDFALRADPKDMDAVRRVLGGLTLRQIDDPTEGVAAVYKARTKRDLEHDLLGTPAQREFERLWKGKAGARAEAEKRYWLHGGRFEPTAADEAGRIAEEGRWIFNRLAYYERLVMEHRGRFARAHDAIGNRGKRMVDIARADAAIAKSAFEEALLEHPPNLGKAATQLEELRAISARLDANIEQYDRETAEAYAAFEGFVVEIVSAVATGGQSLTLRTLLKEFAKQAAATIGTKMIMRGHEYGSPSEILADLRGAAGSALGGHLSERHFANLADDVASWMVKRGYAGPGLARAAGFVAKQEVDTGVGALTSAVVTGEDISGLDPLSQGRSLAIGQAAAGAKRVYGRVRGRRAGSGDAGLRQGPEQSEAPAAGGPSPVPRNEPASVPASEPEGNVVPMSLPEPTPSQGGSPPRSASQPSPPQPVPQPTGAGKQTGAESVESLSRAWQQPDTMTYMPAIGRDPNGREVVLPNVELHPDVEAQVDMPTLLTELERTPWGERIASRIRAGEMRLVIMPSGPDFPFGGLNYAGGKTYIAWRGDVRETVSNAHHEGSHNMDPATATAGAPKGPSRLGVEAEARAFEYEYNELAGLAPRQPSEVDYRAAYRRIEIETAGTHPITPDNPFGADLRRARIEADRAMVAAMRADPDRYAVETRAQEREAVTAHRAPGLRDVPGPGRTGSPRPTPAQPTPPLGFTPLPDTGLVGDEKDPTRRAKIVPSQEYEAGARQLTPREAADITAAQARVRVDIEAGLARVENGRTAGADFDEFTTVIAALRGEPSSGTNQLVLDHAQTVWDAVHDPALIAEVVSELYGESLRRPGSGGYDPLTKATLRAAATSGPIYEVPSADIGDVSFFRHWVATGRRFLDMGVGEDHGNLAHLLQDLVVDRALRRSRAGITAQQYRQALGRVQVAGTRPGPYAPGESLWRVTFDGANSISTPEDLMDALRKVPGLEKLR